MSKSGILRESLNNFAKISIIFSQEILENSRYRSYFFENRIHEALFFLFPILFSWRSNTPENIDMLTAPHWRADLTPLREYKDRETIQWAEEAVESERTAGEANREGRTLSSYCPLHAVSSMFKHLTLFERLYSCEHGCPCIYAERSNSSGQRKVWIVYLTGWRQLTASGLFSVRVFFFLKVKTYIYEMMANTSAVYCMRFK
jgi:hypothetical protein